MSSDVTVHIDSGTVFNLFRKTKERKSPGPDGIGGRILTYCALQLADIFCFLFNMSLQTHRVPQLWKKSVIVPVPKNKAAQSLNDFRPVALTSLAMKSFEKNC